MDLKVLDELKCSIVEPWDDVVVKHVNFKCVGIKAHCREVLERVLSKIR